LLLVPWFTLLRLRGGVLLMSHNLGHGRHVPGAGGSRRAST
jgi:hypothetical protein